MRHRSYSAARLGALEAVFELEAMDYDFQLFTDAESGCDSLVHRGAAGSGPARCPARCRAWWPAASRCPA
ncbi:sigma 54 modulation/S30EA ribosomal C-terminal domain-containing protein [Kitasatospora sp. NPDC093102]|uniref:sigma 54 modulation/S30EA ribosomal C-terminal domain-containing protein n=1 Tax=Kitasatospora sp. NPDC093102 TaxID=3155069 RepID=UPI00341D92FB